ncbi:MAG: superoxide dismutase [Ni], partial [Gammaproteobacteria bacterium]
MRKLAKCLNVVVLATSCTLASVAASTALAHCQIPCGIYDDSARVKSMLEDVATVEKAVMEMKELSNKKDVQSQNQMIRWVANKEKHAQNVIDTISDYFLTQRVKSSQKDYEKRLVAHHEVIVAAMKAKQSGKMKAVKALREAVLVLAPYYPE